MWEGIGCRAGPTVGAPRAARCGATLWAVGQGGGAWESRWQASRSKARVLWSALVCLAVAVPGETGPDLGHLCTSTVPRRGTAGPEQGAAVRQGGNGWSLGARAAGRNTHRGTEPHCLTSEGWVSARRRRTGFAPLGCSRPALYVTINAVLLLERRCCCTGCVGLGSCCPAVAPPAGCPLCLR